MIRDKRTDKRTKAGNDGARGLTREQRGDERAEGRAAQPPLSAALSPLGVLWERGPWIRLLVLSAALFVVLFLRRPDSLLNPQFWAEDGMIYFQQQEVVGFWHSLLAPTNGGYVVLYLRFCAALAYLLPVTLAPMAYNLMALATGAVSCSLFADRTCRHILHSDALRIAVCVVFAATLDLGELSANVTNEQWYLTLAALYLTVRRREDDEGLPWLALAALCLLAAVLALSDPQAAVLAPLLIARMVRFRGKAAATTYAMAAGIVGETLLYVSAERAAPLGFLFAHVVRAAGMQHWLELVRAVLVATGIRAAFTVLLGVNHAAGMAVRLSEWLFYVLFAAATAFVIAVFARRSREDRVKLAVLAYLGFAAVFFAIYERHLEAEFQSLSGVPFGPYTRYFFFPGCLVVVMVALLLEKSPLARWRFGPVYALAGMFALATVNNFAQAPYPDLHWPEHAAAIANWRWRHARGLPVGNVVARVNPPGLPFAILLPREGLAERVDGQPSYAVNAGFETPLDMPWWQLSMRDFRYQTGPAAAHSGSQGLIQEAGYGAMLQDVRLPAADRQYEVSVWVKSSGSGANPRIWFVVLDPCGVATEAAQNLTAPTEWRRLRLEFKPGGCRYARVFLVRDVGAGQVDWDDVVVK